MSIQLEDKSNIKHQLAKPKRTRQNFGEFSAIHKQMISLPRTPPEGKVVNCGLTSFLSHRGGSVNSSLDLPDDYL